MNLTLGTQRILSGRPTSTRLQGCKHYNKVVHYGKGGILNSVQALPENVASRIDIRELSDVITAQTLESEEQRHSLESLAAALGEPLATAKLMAFRCKGLLGVDPGEVKSRVEQVAQIVGVPYEKARAMCVIQPSLLTEPAKQGEALAAGLRLICHDLRAPQEEVVELLLAHPSLLHGRQMRLSVADMAHLALLREPKGRIVD